MWTRFMDMHSGGGQKEKWGHIFIEAPKEEAIKIFYNRFKHNPNRVTCTCCGEDYSISSAETLEKITAFDRNCAWSEDGRTPIEQQNTKFSLGKYMTIDEYRTLEDILIITKEEIGEDEKQGEVPEQGYVWKD